MKNHAKTIILPSKFAFGIILRWLNFHYTPCPATIRRLEFLITIFVAGKAMGIIMRTIAELLNLDGRVYVYVPSKNIRRLFLKNAQEEGFRFADGVKPTRRQAYDDIYALNKDFTLNFVGYIGHIAFNHPEVPNDYNLIRVDYAAYLSGTENYIMEK